jgi:HSP20 family protein
VIREDSTTNTLAGSYNLMSTLDQIRHGFHHAWDSLAEGWHALRQRASHALTRFTPVDSADQTQTPSGQLMQHAAHWAILAGELVETGEHIVIRLEAPGMNPNDFEIEVVDDILVVRGNKHIDASALKGRYYLLERAYGAFERAFHLPAQVDPNQASAQYSRGVLSVALPKTDQRISRRITVSAQ